MFPIETVRALNKVWPIKITDTGKMNF